MKDSTNVYLISAEIIDNNRPRGGNTEHNLIEFIDGALGLVKLQFTY